MVLSGSIIKTNDERPLVIMETSGDWPRDNSGAKWNAVPFLYIPATRINLAKTDFLGQTIEGNADSEIGHCTSKSLFDTDSGTSSMARYVEQAIEWLRSEGDNQRRRNLQMALHLGYSCARSICPEVIHDYAPYPYVEERDSHGPFVSETVVHHDMG